MSVALEQVLTSPAGFALPASALQRAICRVADGLPLDDLAGHPHVAEALGGPAAVAALPVGVPPAELYLLAAIRSGKSLLAAALAVRASQTCDLSGLRPGEVPRVSVISLTTDLARVVYQHLRGTVEARPALRSILIGEPTADSVMLRHPSGCPVEIKIVAGARAGASLVARWSAGAIFDEFPRMCGSGDGVVNFDDARQSVIGRLLPGAQLVAIGSPWAPFGPAWRVMGEHFGHPTTDRVVIRGTGPQMNPAYWTAARCADLERRDPAAYRTDVLGEFCDPEAALFVADDLERVTRAAPDDLPPSPRCFYVAAIDPATRGDAFALAVATKRPPADGEGAFSVFSVVLVRQWQPRPGAPLSPDAILGEIAELLRPYDVRRVVADQWSADALRELGYRHDLYLDDQTVSARSKVDLFESLRLLVADGRVELPPVPELSEDLRRVRKVITQTGVRIELPRAGGRHCDLAFAVALALAQPCGEPRPEPDADDADEGGYQALLAKHRRRRRRAAADPDPRRARASRLVRRLMR